MKGRDAASRRSLSKMPPNPGHLAEWKFARALVKGDLLSATMICPGRSCWSTWPGGSAVVSPGRSLTGIAAMLVSRRILTEEGFSVECDREIRLVLASCPILHSLPAWSHRSCGGFFLAER